MRVVFDTNVLVSAILFGGVPRTALAAAIDGTINLVTSQPLLEEFERVLYEKFGFSSDSARKSRDELESISDIVEPTPIRRVSRDPDDDRFIAAAAVARCDAIVTGDDDLLVLGDYEGIAIIPPRDLGDRLRSADEV